MPTVTAVRLQQRLELFDGQARILHERAHRQGVHGIVARHRENTVAIGQHDVFALSGNPESGAFKRADGFLMGNAGNPWRHARLGDVNLVNGDRRRPASLLGLDGEIIANRRGHVLEGFGFALALRPAARQCRTADGVAAVFRVLLQSDQVFHGETWIVLDLQRPDKLSGSCPDTSAADRGGLIMLAPTPSRERPGGRKPDNQNFARSDEGWPDRR
jgi:hypothetical protein